MKKPLPKTLSAQFINDFDPYEGRDTIPAPLAKELDPDSGWKEFQDTCANYDAAQAELTLATNGKADSQQNR